MTLCFADTELLRKKACTTFDEGRPQFLNDLMDVATFTLGQTSVGSCCSVVEDLLECLETKDLFAVAEKPSYYSFGLVSGLARQLTV